MIIFDKAPFPSCHASTVVETAPGRLLAAWFGGKAEGAKDVQIWSASYDGKRWTAPAVAASEPGSPTWNPVLHKSAKGTLSLYYKAGPSPMTWSGFVQRSGDGGKTWGKAELLPAGMLGPIKNKPIEYKGAILAPSSVESHRAWCCWVERSLDDGKTWTRHGPIQVPGKPHGVIQPTLLVTNKGAILALLRSRGIGYICEAESKDGGLTWSDARATKLPNPGSGIDAVRASDGAFYLAFNNTKLGRSPLNLARSTDDGATWQIVDNAESALLGEFSYPAIIQASDGKLHLVYTYNRRHIKHVEYDPKALKEVK